MNKKKVLPVTIAPREIRGLNFRKCYCFLRSLERGSLKKLAEELGYWPDESSRIIIRHILDDVFHNERDFRNFLLVLPTELLYEFCTIQGLGKPFSKFQALNLILEFLSFPVLADTSKLSHIVCQKISQDQPLQVKYFVEEVLTRLYSERDKPFKLNLNTIIGRLGIYKTIVSVPMHVFSEAGLVLLKNGIDTLPDLCSIKKKLRLSDKITLHLNSDWKKGTRLAFLKEEDYPGLDVLYLGICVARADSKICRSEIQKLSQRAERILPPRLIEERKELRGLVYRMYASHPDESRSLLRLSSQSDNFKKQALEFLFEVAVADQNLHEREESMLSRFSKDLGLNASLVKELTLRWRKNNELPSDNNVNTVVPSSDEVLMQSLLDMLTPKPGFTGSFDMPSKKLKV